MAGQCVFAETDTIKSDCQSHQHHYKMKLSHGNTEILLMKDQLRHIQGGKGEVHCEIQHHAFPGLGITETGVLLRVTYAELNLEPQPVELHDLFAAEGEVSGKIDLRLPMFGIIFYRTIVCKT